MTPVTLVTGAAQGIGAAIVDVLVARGTHVVALDQNPCRSDSGAIRSMVVDVTDRSAVDDAIARVERDLGPIEGLAHAAGILRTGPILELSDDDWDAVMRVNLSGLRHAACAVARVMRTRARGGAIVAVASNAAATPRAGMAAYCASKAAAVMFVKTLGLELAPTIRCNTVSPGSTDTPMQRAFWDAAGGPESILEGSLERFRLGIPLRRLATAHDIAHAVAFLLSDHAQHITLANLCIDGGATLGVS